MITLLQICMMVIETPSSYILFLIIGDRWYTEDHSFISRIYEEAMWWDITENPITLSTSQQEIYNVTIIPDESIGVWCRINLDNPTEGKLGKVIFNYTG